MQCSREHRACSRERRADGKMVRQGGPPQGEPEARDNLRELARSACEAVSR